MQTAPNGAFCSTPGERPSTPLQFRQKSGSLSTSLHKALAEILTPAFISGQFAGVRLGRWYIRLWRWQIRNRMEVESAFPLIWGRNKQSERKKPARKTGGRKTRRQTAQKPTSPHFMAGAHREADSVTRLPAPLLILACKAR